MNNNLLIPAFFENNMKENRKRIKIPQERAAHLRTLLRSINAYNSSFGYRVIRFPIPVGVCLDSRLHCTYTAQAFHSLPYPMLLLCSCFRL